MTQAGLWASPSIADLGEVHGLLAIPVAGFPTDGAQRKTQAPKQPLPDSAQKLIQQRVTGRHWGGVYPDGCDISYKP